MAQVTQLSVQVSVSVKRLLDELSETNGVETDRIIEDALWFYVRALHDLPQSAIVPARIVLRTRSAADVGLSLVNPALPTPQLSRLMSGTDDPGELGLEQGRAPVAPDGRPSQSPQEPLTGPIRLRD